MWIVTAAFAAESDPALAREAVVLPDPIELQARAKRVQTRGFVELGLGAGMITGAGFTLLVGRGESGELSVEEPWVMDLRAAGGGLLAVGGLTTLLVGGHDLGTAKQLKLDAATVSPVFLPGRGGGLVVAARF